MPNTAAAIAGVHSVLHRMPDSTTVPSAATEVSELTSMPDFEVTRETADFHVHTDDWQRSVPTTKSVAAVDFEGIHLGTDADQIALEAAFHSGVKAFYAVTYTEGAYVNGSLNRFEGFVTSFARMASLDDVVKIKFTITITGAPTYAAL